MAVCAWAGGSLCEPVRADAAASAGARRGAGAGTGTSTAQPVWSVAGTHPWCERWCWPAGAGSQLAGRPWRAGDRGMEGCYAGLETGVSHSQDRCMPCFSAFGARSIGIEPGDSAPWPGQGRTTGDKSMTARVPAAIGDGQR